MLYFNNVIFKHKECIQYQNYLPQMGSDTKIICKLGKVCSTFKKISLKDSIDFSKDFVYLCSSYKFIEIMRWTLFISQFFLLFVTSFLEQIPLLLEDMHIMTILASRPQPQMWI